jgi:hypothetical protein
VERRDLGGHALAVDLDRRTVGVAANLDRREAAYWLAYVAAHGEAPELESLRADVGGLLDLLPSAPAAPRLTLAASAA